MVRESDVLIIYHVAKWIEPNGLDTWSRAGGAKYLK